MPTLELIARQTGRPLTFFLAETVAPAQQVPLDDIELMLERGELEQTIQRGERLLADTSDKWSLAQLHLWIGQAHARALRPDEALGHLRQARTIAVDVQDRWLAVECLDWEAAALTTQQSPKALPIAESALSECRELDPRPSSTEARILSRIATIHLVAHDWAKAVAYYEEAIEAAGESRDLARVARIQQGLAVAYGELGDRNRQVLFTHKALAIHSMLRDRASVVMTENNLGMALMKLGDLAGAAQHFESALTEAGQLGMEQMKSHAILSLAELNLMRGNLPSAQRLVSEARELSERLGERLNLGVVAMFEGRIAAEQRNPAEADQRFAAALRIFDELGARERLIECHSAYADVLEARGATRLALEQTKLALAASRPALARSEPSGQPEGRQIGRAG